MYEEEKGKVSKDTVSAGEAVEAGTPARDTLKNEMNDKNFVK